MRSIYTLDFSNKLIVAGIFVMLSFSSLSMLTNHAQAAEDKFGIEELYPTAENGPVWFLNNEKPEADDEFLLTSQNHIQLQEEDSDTFSLDAETGTQKHGVRLHADSPTGEWKNVEMTGYFRLQAGNDQFTLIARQGPTYNDNGGCGAYGYYGLLSANGDAYFKKKLWHHGGYTDRTAVRSGVVDDLNDRWVGIKLVAYDLDNDDVKLELWVDDGDETNNWKKVTEYTDDGNWQVAGSDCDKDGDEIIDEGTRGGFRVDDSQFEFKKLSIREISVDGDSSSASSSSVADEEGGDSDSSSTAAAASSSVADEEPRDLMTVQIISNGTEGVAPATFRFDTRTIGGAGPYDVSWDFGDGIDTSDEKSVLHTFEDAGTYNVAVTVTDSDGKEASDSVEIIAEEASEEDSGD
ncbi:MAG: PKD domain-containing protein [Thermoproteota archaeon]|nr:PKD domain-containing protein [Thermoproteota archaeon]